MYSRNFWGVKKRNIFIYQTMPYSPLNPKLCLSSHFGGKRGKKKSPEPLKLGEEEEEENGAWLLSTMKRVSLSFSLLFFVTLLGGFSKLFFQTIFPPLPFALFFPLSPTHRPLSLFFLATSIGACVQCRGRRHLYKRFKFRKSLEESPKARASFFVGGGRQGLRDKLLLQGLH